MENTDKRFGRTILHVDMNNFFASVECMLNPDLKNFPVAVCGSTKDRHGIVLAKNDKAKSFGVLTAEPIWQAQKKCRNLVTISPHHDEYLKYSKLAVEIYREYTDQIEPFGIDECWLDVTGSRLLFGDGVKIGEEIRRRIRTELGLTVSIGVSFNKTFAKIGSDMKKPDALTYIPYESFHSIIDGLPADCLPGVGEKTSAILKSHGIYTLAALAGAPDSFLSSRLGSAGLILKQHAAGLNFSQVKKADIDDIPKSISHGLTTPKNLTRNEEVQKLILTLCLNIGHKLIEINKKAGSISVCIKNCNLVTHEWQQKLKTPTDSVSIIAEYAFRLFQKNYVWQHEIRSVTVRVSDLCDGFTPVLLDLFNESSRIEKKENIDRTVDALRCRYGAGSVKYCSLIEKNFTADNT